MITEGVDAKELFVSLDNTWSELMELISSTDTAKLNRIPFPDSWTIAQLATHVTKSNRAIAQGLEMKGKPADRNPEEGVPRLKKMFLDFSVKFQSPEFIVPEKKEYSKDTIIETLSKSIEQLKNERARVTLSEIISLPVFGEITKLELFHFVLYHTQRHNHQLKNIIKRLANNNTVK